MVLVSRTTLAFTFEHIGYLFELVLKELPSTERAPSGAGEQADTLGGCMICLLTHN